MSFELMFKIATEAWELEQIHRLNYRTFVEEIPQHERNPEQRLVDKFHSQNTYLICLRNRLLVGMLACRSERPFSLDNKLTDLDSYLPTFKSICEIRLLSIEKHERGGRILLGLMNSLMEHCNQAGYDLAIISGTVTQLKFYENVGFIPFGPLLGKPEAYFQAMYLTIENFTRNSNRVISRLREKSLRKEGLNFLPGPVKIRESVQRAFIQTPVSHRSDQFLNDFARIKRCLKELCNTKNVQILIGTGTLANDVVAAQLSKVKGKGLVLSNGEFGERLIDHARRAKLDNKEVLIPWGEPFTAEFLQKILDDEPLIRWIWVVHLETSTGVLNDLAMLKKVCSERNVLLCMDCISSIGSMTIDLEDVFLATGVSGKALCSYPGLCMIYYNHTIIAGGLPRYLDLGLYNKAEGIPFTHSSNLVYALDNALSYTLVKDFNINIELTAKLRRKLREMNYKIVAPEGFSAPNITTIALPESLCSLEVGQKLEIEGYLLSYKSNYLITRNWIQICLLGDYESKAIENFPMVFDNLLKAKENQCLELA